MSSNRKGKFKNRTELIGKKFGRWTLLKEIGSVNTGTYQRVTWLCKCDCGTEREVYLPSILKGRSTSCGCYNREVVSNRVSPVLKPFGESCFNHLYLCYKRGAKQRGYEFTLTKDEFRVLTKGNCFYCNIEPKQTTGRTKYSNVNGDYVYNGVDRVDNTKGYTFSNCVSSCKWCNRAKWNRTTDEFLIWIKQLTENINAR